MLLKFLQRKHAHILTKQVKESDTDTKRDRESVREKERRSCADNDIERKARFYENQSH